MGVAQKLVTELTIASDLAELRRLLKQLEEALQEATYTEHEIFAIEEALVNAIKRREANS